MPKLTLRFSRMILDSQDFGSDDEHMVSRVFFSVAGPDGKPVGDFHADVKLVVGGSYETDPLEVGPPIGYQGPWDQERFREAVTAYVRRCVGSSGTGIRLGPGAKGIRMRNNTFAFPFEAAIDAKKVTGTW